MSMRHILSFDRSNKARVAVDALSCKCSTTFPYIALDDLFFAWINLAMNGEPQQKVRSAAHDLSEAALGGALSVSGRNFVDAYGRTVLLRGLNVSAISKLQVSRRRIIPDTGTGTNEQRCCLYRTQAHEAQWTESPLGRFLRASFRLFRWQTVSSRRGTRFQAQIELS